MNTKICVVGTSNYILKLKQNFQQNKVVPGKTPFFVGPLKTPLFICLNIGF